MLSRIEEDYLATTDFPYSDKNPLHFHLNEKPVKLKRSELDLYRANYLNFIFASDARGNSRISPERLMERNRPTHPADLMSIRTWDTVHLEPQAPNNKPPVDSLYDQQRNLGTFQRSVDYRSVVQICSSIISKKTKGVCWTQLIGFISSALMENPKQELRFFRMCESMAPNIQDLPHLLHMLDEIKILADRRDLSTCTLLQLNKFKERNLMDSFCRRAHLVPELTKRLRTGPPIASRELERMKVSDHLPTLVPIGEGNFDEARKGTGDKPGRAGRHFSERALERQAKLNNKATDVIDLMKSKKWSPACLVATAQLKKNPNDAEMYINRAMCLINLEKYSDAVIDCTRALAIKRSDKALRLRAGIWMMLGDKLMAQADMDAMEDQSLAGGALARMIDEVVLEREIGDELMTLARARKAGNSEIVFQKVNRPLMEQPVADVEAEAAQFIVLYYQNFVYSPEELPKLYCQETATIWRESLKSAMAVKVEEAHDILVPPMEKGSTVTVINYSVNPNEFGYAISVLGKIEFDTTSRVFVQDFVIAHKYDRIFIVSDSLRLDILGAAQAPADVTYCKPRRKPAKRTPSDQAPKRTPSDQSRPIQPAAEREPPRHNQPRRDRRKNQEENPFIWTSNK